MFEATHRLEFLEYFRIPNRIVAQPPSFAPGGPLSRFCGQLWRSGEQGSNSGVTLSWLLADKDELPISVPKAGRYLLSGRTLFGRVIPDGVAVTWLKEEKNGWKPVQPIIDVKGRHVASVWRHEGGSLFLPFDPSEGILRLWSERYDGEPGMARTRARSLMLRAYYLLRPGLARPVQIALRRAFTHVQRHASFPSWPIDPTLHDHYEWLFQALVELAGRPIPWLDLWPHGYSWALVLTHDVETAIGLANLNLLRDIEREFAYRSAWYFVPLRYETPEDLMAHLREDGCEIGVHGLLHDGRDLGSARLLEERLPAIREYKRRWQASGFRAPATQRNFDWMPLLGFDHDSSYHDTAPFEPIPGGCCSYYPFYNQNLVELPITLPQDHTLFEILQEPDETIWLSKAEHLRSCRGMALVLTHPDYADDPRVTIGYRRLLAGLANDPDLWRALPMEVCAWWRRRSQSSVEESASGWEVRGPAELDGTVRLAKPNARTLMVESTGPQLRARDHAENPGGGPELTIS